MTEEQKRQFSRDMRAYKEKKSQEVKEEKTTGWDIVEFLLAIPFVFLISMIISGLLNLVFFPIIYIIFHDCGQPLCPHCYDCSGLQYWLTTGCVMGFFMIAFVYNLTPKGKAEMRKLEEQREKSYMYMPKEIIECYRCHGTFTLVGGGSYTTCPYCRNRIHIKGRPVYDDLETDYYDEDMEGAPGYYGGE